MSDTAFFSSCSELCRTKHIDNAELIFTYGARQARHMHNRVTAFQQLIQRFERASYGAFRVEISSDYFHVKPLKPT